MELTTGPGQAHVVQCSTQGGSHLKGFLETSLLPSAIFPGRHLEGLYPLQAKSVLKTAPTVCQDWPLCSCAQIWVMLYLSAQRQQQATFRKKYLYYFICNSSLETRWTDTQLFSVPWCALSWLQSFQGLPWSLNLSQVHQAGMSTAAATAPRDCSGGGCP